MTFESVVFDLSLFFISSSIICGIVYCLILMQALAKFEHLWEIGIDAEYKVELLPEIQAIEQAEKQKPEQEPVAWMVLTQDDKKLMLYGEEKPPIFNTPVKLIPLYTAPPKREWVGLHLDDIPETYAGDKSFLNITRWAEAKLKEKNGE